jgi:ribosomal protein S18 acetylase RimI-like enzyme
MNGAPAARLRPLTAGDAASVYHLWATRFGGRPGRIHHWIDTALNPQTETTGHVAVPTRGEAAGLVVGFGVLEIGSRSYARDYLGGSDLPLRLDLADSNGIFHMYGVDRDWEHRGIATRLYRRHLAHLRSKRVRRAFGVSWHRPQREGADSRAVFEKTGFRPVATVEEFYARTSPRTGCPDCGDACGCTASIYAIRLDPGASRRTGDGGAAGP